MDTNKMRNISREQFELRYPVPEGCCWNAEQGRYVLFHLKLCTLGKYEEFVETWVCWQASREAVMVELPPVPEVPEDPEDAIDDSHMDAYYSAVGMRQACAQFIKAAGLKVTP